MLEGLDFEGDPMGLKLTTELMCGECNCTMVHLNRGKYQCPCCMTVFEDYEDDPFPFS